MFRLNARQQSRFSLPVCTAQWAAQAEEPL